MMSFTRKQSLLTLCGLTFLLQIAVTESFAAAPITADDEISAYFRVMWGLLIVLALILFLYGIFRKRFSIISTKGDKAIKVIEIQPLMPKKSLCLVEVRGKEYLIGVGQENINLIADLSKKSDSLFKQTLDRSQAEIQS